MALRKPRYIVENLPPTYTQDGHLIRLSVNMEVDSDPALLHAHGSSGIGLLRSENLLSGLSRFPGEAEQFIYYRTLVRQMRGLPTVIRVFDVHEAQLMHIKPNTPYSPLGSRAIRFLLREPKIFKRSYAPFYALVSMET